MTPRRDDDPPHQDMDTTDVMEAISIEVSREGATVGSVQKLARSLGASVKFMITDGVDEEIAKISDEAIAEIGRQYAAGAVTESYEKGLATGRAMERNDVTSWLSDQRDMFREGGASWNLLTDVMQAVALQQHRKPKKTEPTNPELWKENSYG